MLSGEASNHVMGFSCSKKMLLGSVPEIPEVPWSRLN
jgi:hypothetical protein